MKTPNEFWLNLHRLSAAYEAEGENPRQRLENVLQQLQAMPPIARREVLADFALLARNLDEIYMAAVALHRQLERQSRVPKQEGAA